jgi:hypothetical protein
MKARDLFEMGAAPAVAPVKPGIKPGHRPLTPQRPAPGKFPSPSRRKFPGKREEELPKPKACDTATKYEAVDMRRQSGGPGWQRVPRPYAEKPAGLKSTYHGKNCQCTKCEKERQAVENSMPRIGAAWGKPYHYAPGGTVELDSGEPIPKWERPERKGHYESRASLIVKRLLA